jgi:hypothetical protein
LFAAPLARNVRSGLASLADVQQTAGMSGKVLHKLSSVRLIPAVTLCSCLLATGCEGVEPPSTHLLECSSKVSDSPPLLLLMDTGRKKFTRVDSGQKSIGALSADRYRYSLDVELEAGKVAAVEINRYSGFMSATRSAKMGNKMPAWAPTPAWSCSRQPESPKL